MELSTKMTFTLMTILSQLWLTSCTPAVVSPNKSYQEAWAKSPTCTLRLVAYRTSKHSKYVLEEIGSGNLFIMTGLGGRRIPTLQLGETLLSKCDYSNEGKRITEFESYRTSIVVHTDGTVFRHLPGYEYLEKSLQRYRALNDNCYQRSGALVGEDDDWVGLLSGYVSCLWAAGFIGIEQLDDFGWLRAELG